MTIRKISAITVTALFASLAFAEVRQDHLITPVPYQPGITMTQSVQASITPEQAITILKAGNERFQTGKTLRRDSKQLIQQTALSQYPFASILTCIDSRVGPEIIFDQNIGDIFVARVAGNIVNDDMMGSLEYAAVVAGSRAIVVLGHTHCGAIKGACDGVKLGKLTGLLNQIHPAVVAAKTTGERNAKNHEFVDEVTEINVENTIKAIREKSLILKELESKGKITIVGAVYNTSTGKIQWL
jgi:carbonic anhydrase